MNNTTLEYSQVTEITQHPMFWGILLGILLFTIMVYVVIGVLREAKTPGGKVVLNSNGRPKRMIMTSGYWIAFSIWALIPTTLIIATIIFPWWLRF